MLDLMIEPKNVIRTNEKVESIVIELNTPFSTPVSDINAKEKLIPTHN